MHENEIMFDSDEIKLLNKLSELTACLKFASTEKKKQFWQDLRILQYEYFSGSLPKEMIDGINRLCGVDESGLVSQTDL